MKDYFKAVIVYMLHHLTTNLKNYFRVSCEKDAHWVLITWNIKCKIGINWVMINSCGMSKAPRRFDNSQWTFKKAQFFRIKPWKNMKKA